MKKLIAVLAALLTLSACGQANDAEITETTVSVSQSEEVTEETAVTTEVETTAAQETTATAEIEPEIPLTPLEQVYKYCEDHNNDFLLYDFTGDNFPETVEIWGAESGCDYCIRDLNGNIIGLCSNGWVLDNKVYVCNDEGRKYIVVAYNFSTVGWTQITAKRIDFYENGDVAESTLGYAEIYQNYERSYNSVFSFEDSGISPIGFYSDNLYTDIENEQVYNIFSAELEKYLSHCEIIDEITFGQVIECTSQPADFSEYPNEDHLFEEENEHGYDPYYSDEPFHLSDDGKSLSVYMNRIPEDFDFESLKEFENVRELWIHGEYGDNVDDLDFVKYFPETEVVHSYFFISSPEVLRPLTELPNLAVIADSGQGSYLRAGLTKEEREDLEEMLADYIWTFIK